PWGHQPTRASDQVLDRLTKKAHPRRPLMRRNAPKHRDAAAVGCSGWILIMVSLDGRKPVPKVKEETSRQLHNSAACHRLREFGRKSLDRCLTTIVVNVTISPCSTSKSSMIPRRRRWPW